MCFIYIFLNIIYYLFYIIYYILYMIYYIFILYYIYLYVNNMMPTFFSCYTWVAAMTLARMMACPGSTMNPEEPWISHENSWENSWENGKRMGNSWEKIGKSWKWVQLYERETARTKPRIYMEHHRTAGGLSWIVQPAPCLIEDQMTNDMPSYKRTNMRRMGM